MSVAVEAGIPKAKLAWKRMMEYGGHKGKYGVLIVPRSRNGQTNLVRN